MLNIIENKKPRTDGIKFWFLLGKRITLLILSIALSKSLNAQITFQKTYYTNFYANYGRSVGITNDGGYIIGGYFADSFQSWIYLIKTDSIGDTLWTKRYAVDSWDFCNSIQQTSDGGYIFAGSTASNIIGYDNILLIKTNSSGNVQWSKSYGSGFEDNAYLVQQTMDGGFIIAGSTSGYGAGSKDIYLLKTDINGNLVWTETFGGTSGDIGYSIQQTSDGGYIVGGSLGNKLCLVKTNINGDSTWTRTFGGSQSEGASSVRQTTDGGYLAAGFSSSFGAGNDDIYLVKTDSSGMMIWSKTFGGTEDDRASYVKQTSDGGFIIAGYTYSFGGVNSDAYLIKVDASGNLLWSKTFGGVQGEEASSVLQTSDAGYVITGRYQGGIYLIKTDSLGNSGCNESTPLTIVTTPGTLVLTVPITVSTGGSGTTHPITVGSGGVVTTLCTTVGELENSPKKNLVKIFPNPATTHLTIALGSTNKKVEVTITDITGKIIYTTTATETQKIEVNIKDFAEGIYLVQIKCAEFLQTEKLIVTK